MTNEESERGAALIGAVLAVVILSMLGTVSLNVAAQEIASVAAARDEAVARHLAEAGADLVLQWFHDPAMAPAGAGRALFTKQQAGSDGSPSFFDAAGHSQFSGTEDRPDVLYDAARPADHRLLNDPSGGWFRSLSALGRIRKLAVYGPTTPGLLCTVEVTAETQQLTRTLVVQLGAKMFPPIRAGVQIGNRGPVPAARSPLPLLVHWGDLVVNGDVRLGTAQDIPVKTALAPVTGQPYAELAQREDRWLDVFIGGAALFTPVVSGSVPVPSNVYPQQEPAPGLRQDQWEYQVMKEHALRDGTYYARGQDGLLYRHGRMEPGLGLTVDEVFRSATVGDFHGLVFVDTLDRTPPREENLGALNLETEYAEGVFVINANVKFVPRGAGRSVSAFSPPAEERGAGESRTPVQLTGIHLHGAIVTPGELSFDGRPRIYGALIVGGTVTQASDSADHLEVWYDDDLRKGLIRGAPLVYPAPGTRQEKYGEKRT